MAVHASWNRDAESLDGSSDGSAAGFGLERGLLEDLEVSLGLPDGVLGGLLELEAFVAQLVYFWWPGSHTTSHSWIVGCVLNV